MGQNKNSDNQLSKGLHFAPYLYHEVQLSQTRLKNRHENILINKIYGWLGSTPPINSQGVPPLVNQLSRGQLAESLLHPASKDAHHVVAAAQTQLNLSNLGEFILLTWFICHTLL